MKVLQGQINIFDIQPKVPKFKIRDSSGFYMKQYQIDYMIDNTVKGNTWLKLILIANKEYLERIVFKYNKRKRFTIEYEYADRIENKEAELKADSIIAVINKYKEHINKAYIQTCYNPYSGQRLY